LCGGLAVSWLRRFHIASLPRFRPPQVNARCTCNDLPSAAHWVSNATWAPTKPPRSIGHASAACTVHHRTRKRALVEPASASRCLTHYGHAVIGRFPSHVKVTVVTTPA